MNSTETKTRLALLGTLGHLHTEPLRYDLACLRSLVETLEPDLLGVEVDPDGWERGDLSEAPVEVREGLVPAANRVDTVVCPWAVPRLWSWRRQKAVGWRGYGLAWCGLPTIC